MLFEDAKQLHSAIYRPIQFDYTHLLQLDAAFLLPIGSFLLTIELSYSQLTTLAFLLTMGAWSPTNLAILLTIGAFFAYNGKVRLISALRDRKQRSLTVSKNIQL